MSDLKSRFETTANIKIGAALLRCLPSEALHWVAPWPGRRPAISEGLQNFLGVALPDPGQVLISPEGRCLWAGRDAAFLEAAEVPAELERHGAVVDVSDGWVRFGMSGAASADVLARLCPVDLRASLYQHPTSLRTSVGHVSALIVAGQPEVEIWVMRSFAASVQDELVHAMEAVAARDVLRA